jgi:hypothetical protein
MYAAHLYILRSLLAAPPRDSGPPYSGANRAEKCRRNGACSVKP